MNDRRQLNRIAAAVFLIAGSSAVLATVSPPVRDQSLDGSWLSDGYGLLVEIKGSSMSVYQLTSISCVPFWTAERTDVKDDKFGVVYKRGGDLIHLVPGSSPEVLVMRESNTVSSISLRRTANRPGTCLNKLPDTPQNNYAVFWQTYAEQFALFRNYHTDWDAVDRKYRALVSYSTTPQELFEILRDMIQPFHNAHTNINAGSINKEYVGYRPVSDIGLELQKNSSLSIKEILDLFSKKAECTKEIIAARYIDGKLRSYCNGVIDYGMLKGGVGYLRMLAFDGYVKEGGFELASRNLEEALDEIFTNSTEMKGLIIDVRVNTGGADPFCLSIASRLTGERYLAYSKVARNNLSGPLRFTRPQPSWVDVTTRPGFRGKVILLIGPDTISGGETFAMALMGRKPHITTVGENTQGVFSDVVGHKLPNGWYFGLPNELYLTGNGESFDIRGVPPDVRVPVFRKRDLENRRDGAVEKALEILRKQ